MPNEPQTFRPTGTPTPRPSGTPARPATRQRIAALLNEVDAALASIAAADTDVDAREPWERDADAWKDV